MGTFVAETPSDKIYRAMRLVENRMEMIDLLPEASEMKFLKEDYRALHSLLNDSGGKIQFLEELCHAGQISMSVVEYAWANAAIAAAIVLGEDPEGDPVDLQGNPVNV